MATVPIITREWYAPGVGLVKAERSEEVESPRQWLARGQCELRGQMIVAAPAAPWTLKVGGLHAVARDPATRVSTGAADPRRDGYAIGA